jgi:diguanylate cyclase (GGDEF)-like protein
MCYIDHFKKFNDTYGHDVGDEVSKLVASKLNNISGGGKTFRFGGEEFIIIFPRKTAAQVILFV